ncbi:MAG: hypothetical protein WC542_14935 [Paludibacter sp.]|jgi:hypothetical protein
MKTKTIICFIFTVFILLSCEKKPKYEIYENHEISACGINDPMKNSQWISEFIEKNMESTNNITIYLYSNSETKEENIVIDITPNGGENSNVSIDPFFWKKVYSCAGVQMFVSESEGIDREGWNHFFFSGQNSIEGIIWYSKIVY